MTACANAEIMFKMVLFEKYGMYCHEGSKDQYIRNQLKLDLELSGVDCKKKQDCAPKFSGVSFNKCYDDLIIDDNPCSTC